MLQSKHKHSVCHNHKKYYCSNQKQDSLGCIQYSLPELSIFSLFVFLKTLRDVIRFSSNGRLFHSVYMEDGLVEKLFGERAVELEKKLCSPQDI